MYTIIFRSIRSRIVDPLESPISQFYTLFQAQIRTNRQPNIEVRELPAGSRAIAQAMESDERYQIKSTPQFAIESKKGRFQHLFLKNTTFLGMNFETDKRRRNK